MCCGNLETGVTSSFYIVALRGYEVSVSSQKKSIFFSILRGTGMMIITVVHFTPSAQTSDGQHFLDSGGRLMLG